MDIKKYIPNTITCLNLFTGCIAVCYGFRGNYWAAFLCILIAGIFDFLDGFFARILKAYSPMGKELDSLADVVSFGLAPGAIVFALLSHTFLPDYFFYLAFLIPVFSALRLAKFNIDTRQSDSFLGLAVPANAIFFGGIVSSYYEFFLSEPWVLIALVFVFSGLLITEIPMFSLKMKSIKWSQNKIQYIFLLGCLVLIAVFWLDAFAPIIVWYIMLSVINAVISLRKYKNF